MSAKDRKKYIGTIDLEPTWSGLLPWMLSVMADPKERKAQAELVPEFYKMARAADAYRALQREGKVP